MLKMSSQNKEEKTWSDKITVKTWKRQQGTKQVTQSQNSKKREKRKEGSNDLSDHQHEEYKRSRVTQGAKFSSTAEADSQPRREL